MANGAPLYKSCTPTPFAVPALPCPVNAITLVLALSGFCTPLSETVILVPALQLNPRFCVFCAPAGVVPTVEPNVEAGISPMMKFN